jgi:anti-sigma factor RsiW
LVTVMTTCKDCRSHLPDLLLDDAFTSTHPEYKEHLSACAACRTELAELRSTFALLDEWKAPELSPYFDSRLQARLREAAAAPPEGFWERTRSFFLFSTGRQLRPALAGALAFAMIIGGGGAFVGLRGVNPGIQRPQTSATVNDLKILDNNVQAEQQLNQLLDDSTPSADDGAVVPTT